MINLANTMNFSVRLDSDIKKQCEALYGELGVNLTTAINVFLRQSLRAGGFPSDVPMEQPNKETIARNDGYDHPAISEHLKIMLGNHTLPFGEC